MSVPTRLAFDEFEFRTDSGELLREGPVVIQLQPQPAKLLELLAGRAGEVVSREEIRQFVWGDSFVDFDASLNFCVKQLRRALGDSSTSPRYIETLPRRGYRFLRPVRKTPTAEIALDGIPAPAPAPAPSSAAAARAGWRLPAGLAVTAAALILLIVFLIASRFPPAPPPGLHPRLAVFPLACQSGNPVDQQICGGVTEALTAELTRQFPKDLEVIAPTSSQVYQTNRRTQDIGKEVGATHLLMGAVETSRQRLHIDARLATTGGKTLWRGSFNGEVTDPPSVYQQIAQRVARTLKLPLPTEPPVNDRPSQEASEAFLKGTYLRHQWQFAEATKILEEAVLLAPRYARAYAELALARTDRQGVLAREDGPASRAAAQQALQLNPQLPEAHLAMAEVLFKDFFDFKGSEAEYLKAMVLSPGNAEILHYYATYLMALGDFDNALQTMRRARELDPVSMEVESDYAWFLFMARHYKEAVLEARSTLTLLKITQATIPPIADFGRSWAYHVLLFGSLRLGDKQTALSSGLERMRERGNGTAAKRLRSVSDLLEWRHQYVAGLVPDHPGISYALAQTAAVTGRTGEALDALEEECRNGGEGIMFNFVAVEPLFDSLHSDPRFAKIVDCTHLPKDAPARRALKAETATR